MANVDRRTVDLSDYPDLVVIYLGMRVNEVRGIKALARLGPQISRSVADHPDGLLRHENVLFGLVPPHAGMRQYWRDFASLERWARSLPHREWWKRFLDESDGTGFWHELYTMRGGMEAVYDNMSSALGLGSFARTEPARGGMFSARGRLRLEGAAAGEPARTEDALYLTG